jgi:hypothetical protein
MCSTHSQCEASALTKCLIFDGFKALPDSIGELKALVNLDLFMCNELKGGYIWFDTSISTCLLLFCVCSCTCNHQCTAEPDPLYPLWL